MGFPKLLSDNGIALTPHGAEWSANSSPNVERLGVEAITGKPYKPTTQGKNERFHQTLFRYLGKQPLAETLTELQAQLDAFDHIYNTQRPSPRAPQARHTPGCLGSDPQGRSTPPQTGPAAVRTARATPAARSTSAIGPAR